MFSGGGRLAFHILIKNWGEAEDFRCQNWRKEWGKTEWWRSFLQIYLLQGFFLFIIALPIIAYMQYGCSFCFCFSPPSMLDHLSVFPILIIGIGFIIEAIADYQKSKFKKIHPQGLMKTGLWKYSRHPNYFGEAIFWWGIAFYCSVEVNLIYGLISAGTITFLLRYVSGVPMLEKAKEGNEDYKQYKKETPVFIPFLKP